MSKSSKNQSKTPLPYADYIASSHLIKKSIEASKLKFFDEKLQRCHSKVIKK